MPGLLLNVLEGLTGLDQLAGERVAESMGLPVASPDMTAEPIVVDGRAVGTGENPVRGRATRQRSLGLLGGASIASTCAPMLWTAGLPAPSGCCGAEGSSRIAKRAGATPRLIGSNPS
jgi:hypothetical protein